MTNFNSQNAASGDNFERTVEYHLRSKGWALVARKATEFGIEIDRVMVDPQGQRFWIECKGSPSDENRSGGRRTDTIKKAIADAWYLWSHGPERVTPYLLFLSHLPERGVALAELTRAVQFGIIAAVRTPWGQELAVEGSPEEWSGDGTHMPCGAMFGWSFCEHDCGELPWDENHTEWVVRRRNEGMTRDEHDAYVADFLGDEAFYCCWNCWKVHESPDAALSPDCCSWFWQTSDEEADDADVIEAEAEIERLSALWGVGPGSP